MQLTSQFAQVTDANGGTRVAMAIRVAFDAVRPVLVEHNDCAYMFTGKAGTNLTTGTAARELATAADARIWISLDGTSIWEN